MTNPSDTQAGTGSDQDRRQTLVIMGARGDLTSRLLLPGLGGLIAESSLRDLVLIGTGRGSWSQDEWQSVVSDSFAAGKAEGDAVDAVVRSARYVRADVTDEDDLRSLLSAGEGRITLYFALPSAAAVKACEVLARIGVPEGTRLVLEKPFGVDAGSARDLNELLHGLVPEDHVHRVDHFLGMSTVLNILGIRFANRVVEPLLTSEHVAAVDILFEETLGLEGRAAFYDATGALRDMIQSHLLQVMTLVAMLPPATLDPPDLGDAKAQVLRATRVWDDDPERYSRRARYTAGDVGGKSLPSYADEDGIDPAQQTETLAEVVFAVDTWRWSGVPFRVRSGKAIGSPRQEVTVTFRDPQHVPAGLGGEREPNRLTIGLGPRTVGLDININGAGDPFSTSPVTLDTDFGAGELLEYGEVLKSVLNDETSLSVRDDMSVESWRIVQPVLDAWSEGRVPLDEYRAGTAGPESWGLLP
ncbi:glucose-6-phosphate dehydrogenase [Arthrobacter echini]|uniref:Glucose-6-phosphate dehydrogenase n=1 Tax=Arthrobacter echini TaxID=1529066 RepID=A0A4S5E8I8_9MICC|nr:glucose-6-phosphate dehydrogenase [Arthrobacter echini]THJ67948.1 glucose-6-phosphate dehydrogenase [Arthrobacter echini]